MQTDYLNARSVIRVTDVRSLGVDGLVYAGVTLQRCHQSDVSDFPKPVNVHAIAVLKRDPSPLWPGSSWPW